MAERDCSMDERQKMHEDDWVYKDTRPISDEYTKAEIDEKLDAVDVKFNSYLSLDGGALTGNIIERNTDSDHLGVSGSYWGHGAYLWLSGQNSGYAGAWYLSARDTEKSCDLVGSPAGVLSWGGKLVLTEDDLSNYATKTELNAKANASDLTIHTNNTDIHVTTADKNKWNSKQDALSNQQLSNIADVANKANDADVVHTTGNETVGGMKTFTGPIRMDKTTPYIALDISDCDVTEIPTEAKSATLYFRDKNYKNLSYIVAQQRISGEKRMCLRTHRTDIISNYYSVDLDSDGNFYPEQGNVMRLGTPALKWADVNTVLLNGKTPDTIEEQGADYIRYSSGLQICWGTLVNSSNVDAGITQINFAKGFSEKPSVFASVTENTNSFIYVCQPHDITITYFLAYCYSADNNQRLSDTFWFTYQAIGYWK